jgi:hypothetical protein
LTARPDEHGGAVKWQRAPAAWIGKSGGVFLGDTECCTGRQQNERQLPSRSPFGNDSASGRRKNCPRPLGIVSTFTMRFCAAMTRKYVIILILLFIAFSAAADTIVLKSGKRVEVDMAWEENERVKGSLSGVSLSYPKSEVERIERSMVEDPSIQHEGFKFDVWYSGMNLDDVQRVAEKNNIILVRDEVNRDQRDPNDSANSKTNGKILYKEQLLGKLATVELLFTPVTQTLYTLSIHWTDVQDHLSSEFSKKLMSNLFDRYGKPAKEETKIFNTIISWQINKNGNVALRLGKEVIELTYLDTAIEKVAKEERKATRP